MRGINLDGLMFSPRSRLGKLIFLFSTFQYFLRVGVGGISVRGKGLCLTVLRAVVVRLPTYL